MATTHHLSDPDKVLQTLQEGNQRFVTGKTRVHDHQQQILDTKIEQHPKAIVLGCMDSRSIPEFVFDQGIGEIFTIRLAGNVINQDVLGSMEFGVKVAGAQLIIVLGHTNCGAVTAAYQHNNQLNNLMTVLQYIQRAVDKTLNQGRPSSSLTQQKNHHHNHDTGLIDAIAKQHAINMVIQIPQESTLIAKKIQAGKLKIVGAMYNIATGAVSFFDHTGAALCADCDAVTRK